jgi:hypothetical protein
MRSGRSLGACRRRRGGQGRPRGGRRSCGAAARDSGHRRRRTWRLVIAGKRGQRWWRVLMGTRAVKGIEGPVRINDPMSRCRTTGRWAESERSAPHVSE